MKKHLRLLLVLSVLQVKGLTGFCQDNEDSLGVLGSVFICGIFSENRFVPRKTLFPKAGD
jgi:hypothetical protein